MTDEEMAAVQQAAADRLGEDMMALLDSMVCQHPLTVEPWKVRDIPDGRLMARFETENGQLYIKYFAVFEPPVEFITISLKLPEGDSNANAETEQPLS
jgi:hypothetical protein